MVLAVTIEPEPGQESSSAVLAAGRPDLSARRRNLPEHLTEAAEQARIWQTGARSIQFKMGRNK